MVNVFDPLELCEGAGAEDFAPDEGGGGGRLVPDGASVFVGVAAPEEGAGGGGVGLLPPMFKEIVGGGGGASVCSGRSIGANGGVDCAGAGAGTLNLGTNSEAEKLSLLMLNEELL